MVDTDRVDGALRRSQDHLLRLQAPAGYWVGELEADSTITSEYLLLRHLLENRDQHLERKAVAYLREREQTTAVYREMTRGVWLEGQPDRRVEALCYVVDRGHPQYAGRLNHDRQLHIVRQGHGRSGNNRDYVLETVKALEALGIIDHDLHVLAERLKGSQDVHVS